MKQATIKKEFVLSGIGLHKGSMVDAVFSPSAAGSGIVIENAGEKFRLDVKLVTETERGTVLKKGKSVIHTVEHMLSAVKALGIDNLNIMIKGDEAPALDGSALMFVKALKKAGIRRQLSEKKVFKLKNPEIIAKDGKYMAALPGTGFTVIYFSDFSAKGIAPQEAGGVVTPKKYLKYISAARTFGFKNEIDALKKAGLIKGANLSNAIVIDKGRPLHGRLRYKNELTRHKVLDLIGDFAFIEGQINMTVIAYKTGHTENIEMVRKVLKKV